MSFSSQWLALREPVDHAARNQDIISALKENFKEKTALAITDIGSGTGSTIRALKPALDKKINWHLIDYDDALIEVAKKEAGSDNVEFTLADLSKSLDSIFSNAPDIITTSAFLDLVSSDWLEWLVNEVTSRNLPFYAAITYDGRAGCAPKFKADQDVIEAFNMHQKTDKGFGPALGPDAADTAIKLFENAGYKVQSGQSDWQGTHKHKEFQKMLLDGWKIAASEIEPEQKQAFDEWLTDRNTLIHNGIGSLFVGHKDFIAFPKG